MSIKEALERGPLERERNIRSFLEQTPNPYKAMALEEGKKILNEAGIPKLLQELAEIVVKSGFPKVEVTKPVLWRDDFSVGMDLRWNFRDEDMSKYGQSKNEPYCDHVSVRALPISQDLVIAGRQLELLGKSEWRSKPETLEDAIVRAYKNPMPFTLRPVRIR